jgi:hypothetical protein
MSIFASAIEYLRFVSLEVAAIIVMRKAYSSATLSG